MDLDYAAYSAATVITPKKNGHKFEPRGIKYRPFETFVSKYLIAHLASPDGRTSPPVLR